jgi:hypothetical protein
MAAALQRSTAAFQSWLFDAGGIRRTAPGARGGDLPGNGGGPLRHVEPPRSTPSHHRSARDRKRQKPGRLPQVKRGPKKTGQVKEQSEFHGIVVFGKFDESCATSLIQTHSWESGGLATHQIFQTAQSGGKAQRFCRQV